jgi:hypothetical protein
MHSVWEAVWVEPELESMRDLSDATDWQISQAVYSLVERRVQDQTDRGVYMPVYDEARWSIDYGGIPAEWVADLINDSTGA